MQRWRRYIPGAGGCVRNPPPPGRHTAELLRSLPREFVHEHRKEGPRADGVSINSKSAKLNRPRTARVSPISESGSSAAETPPGEHPRSRARSPNTHTPGANLWTHLANTADPPSGSSGSHGLRANLQHRVLVRVLRDAVGRPCTLRSRLYKYLGV